MNWSELVSYLELEFHRVGIYVLLTFNDDAAWLALMFC